MNTSRLQATLAIIITLMVAAIGVLFAFRPPDSTNTILISMIGTVMTVFVMTYSYFFGSSPGSKDKDETIKQLSMGMPVPATPSEEKPPVVPSVTKLAGVSSG